MYLDVFFYTFFIPVNKGILSSIRHRQSNPTKRVMKELSRLFRAYCHDSHANWYSILPNIELLFNVTPHLSTGFSPYEIISGKNPPNALTNLIEPLLPAVAAKPLQQIHSEALSNLRRAANQRKNSKRNLRRIPSVRLCPVKGKSYLGCCQQNLRQILSPIFWPVPSLGQTPSKRLYPQRPRLELHQGQPQHHQFKTVFLSPLILRLFCSQVHLESGDVSGRKKKKIRLSF